MPEQLRHQERHHARAITGSARVTFVFCPGSAKNTRKPRFAKFENLSAAYLKHFKHILNIKTNTI